MVLSGKDLKEPIRVLASRKDVVVKVEKVEATEATVSLTLPPDSRPGPLGLYVATEAGAQPTQILLVDDLKTARDQGNNHSRETAQAIETLSAVDGICDGPVSDFYRFTATAGQRIAFSVVTQAVGSKMDPMVRLTDAAGKTVVLADDDDRGPECSFSHRFDTAGDYWLELRDSRYASGHSYHLRVGDFPIIVHASPLAIQRGQEATIHVSDRDSLPIEPIKIVAPSEVEVRSMTIAAKIAGAESKSAAWVTLAISDNVQQVEPEQFSAEAAPLTLPFGLTGRLSSANERDKYLVQGTPGQATRFRARTRSLATPTLLQMELFNHATNAKVAETKVADTDEWSFDFTFPDNAVYRLETTDLLHRGGTAFGYYIEARPAGSFAIDLKPAAETKESYLLEPQHGAAALDLVIDRFGYDGEIALSLGGEAAGLRLSPDKIPTGAKEARVYLFADEAWQPNALRALRFIARSTTDPSIQSSLSSLAAHRIKQPHIPFPSDWNDGVIEAVEWLHPNHSLRWNQLLQRRLRNHAATTH